MSTVAASSDVALAALAGGGVYIVRREPNDTFTLVQSVRGDVDGCCMAWSSSGRSVAIGDELGGVTVTSRTGKG